MINPNHLPRNQELHTIDDLAIFLGGSATSFTGELLQLIAKADPLNQMRLAKGFPDAVWGWRMWQSDMPAVTVGYLQDALEAMRKVWPGRHWE